MIPPFLPVVNPATLIRTIMVATVCALLVAAPPLIFTWGRLTGERACQEERAREVAAVVQQHARTVDTAQTQYREQLADAQARALAEQDKLETEIARHEAALAHNSRDCRLSADELRWLLD